MSQHTYTAFRTDFPTFALVDAFDAVKSGAIDKPKAEILSHAAVELLLWALGCYFGGKATFGVGSTIGAVRGMTDAEAYAILEQSQAETPGIVGASLIPPAKALALAWWLFKIILPVIL
jgi:hypothetical protein